MDDGTSWGPFLVFQKLIKPETNVNLLLHVLTVLSSGFGGERNTMEALCKGYKLEVLPLLCRCIVNYCHTCMACYEPEMKYQF